MQTRRGLRSRLGRAFIIQALLISVAALVGVYAAAFTIEDVLIKQALEEEASHFWLRHRENAEFPTPDTRNLTGYIASLDDDSTVPDHLRGLANGFHRLSSDADFSVAYVTEQAGRRLHLVFDGERVRELAVFFGLVPLGLVLAVLYLVTWLAWRVSQRAVSPVEWLAKEVQRLDPESPDDAVFAREHLPGNPDREVEDLADALARLTRRINEFVERERNFTRDASHELRSPLTVIRIAADMLLSEQELERPVRNSVLRIKRSASDMEELTEAFLLLARESEHGNRGEPVCVNDVVAEELERAGLMVGDKPLQLESSASCRLFVDGSDRALSVLVGNLLRNAVSYTDQGYIRVHIGDERLEVEDSGQGMDADEVGKVFTPFFRGGDRQRGGHGVGLTIVKRFSDRFGWPVRIDSTPGVGTRVVVEFPGARGAAL